MHLQGFRGPTQPPFSAASCPLLSKPVCFQRVSTSSRRKWYSCPSSMQLPSYTCSMIMERGPRFSAQIEISNILKQVKCLSIFENPMQSSVTQHLLKSSHWCASAGGSGVQSWVRFFQQLFRIRHFLHFVKSGF